MIKSEYIDKLVGLSKHIIKLIIARGDIKNKTQVSEGAAFEYLLTTILANELKSGTIKQTNIVIVKVLKIGCTIITTPQNPIKIKKILESLNFSF